MAAKFSTGSLLLLRLEFPRFECFQKKRRRKRFRAESIPAEFLPSVCPSVCQSASDRKKSFLKASIIAISPYDSCTTLYCTMQSSKIKFRFRSSCRNKSRLTCRFMSRAQTRFRFVKELHQKWKIWSRDMRLRNTNLRKLRNELITMFFFFYLGFYANIFKTHCLFMYGYCFLFLLPIYSYLKIGDNER